MSTAAEHHTSDDVVDLSEPVGRRSQSDADRFMRRLLRLPEGTTSTAAAARSAFQKSLLFTTCRCLLMYIVFPFVLPAVGVARGVGPYIGLTIGVSAPILLVSLGTIVSGRAGLVNIGQEGQLVMGSCFAAFAASRLAGPGPFVLLISLAIGIVGGAIWAGIAGVLR